jgi:hypothetical protein
MASVTEGEVAAVPAADGADVSADAETPPSVCEGAGELMRVALLKKALTHSREGRMATLCCEPADDRAGGPTEGERKGVRNGRGVPCPWKAPPFKFPPVQFSPIRRSPPTCQHDASRRRARRVEVRLSHAEAQSDTDAWFLISDANTISDSLSPLLNSPSCSCLVAVAAASASGVAATARVTDAPTPAFAFNLGINAIEYLKDQALNTLLPKLQHLALPDVSGNPKVCSQLKCRICSMGFFCPPSIDILRVFVRYRHF